MQQELPTQVAIPGWPIVARGLLMAQLGPIVAVYNDETIDDEGWALHLREIALSIDLRSRGGKTGVVYDVPSASAIDGRRRQQLAAVLDARKAQLAATTGHYALATSSPIVRAYLKTIFWLAPPPYPWSIEATARDGFRAVARVIPTVDPIAVGRAWEVLLARHGALLARSA